MCKTIRATMQLRPQVTPNIVQKGLKRRNKRSHDRAFGTDLTNQQRDSVGIDGLPSKKKKNSGSSNCVIFLDWDDTLMPTTLLLQSIDRATRTMSKLHISALENAGNMSFALSTRLISTFSAKHIKIVTKASNGWIPRSLSIAGIFCETFKRIETLLAVHRIQVFYARNFSVKAS